MPIDFSKCRVISPEAQLAQAMYEDLWKIFPYDRQVYDQILNKGKKLYSLINKALFAGDEFIGNAGLFPLKLWYKGKIVEFIGVGAVATMPKYRRQGVASYLMDRCMDEIDRLNKPSILFTELPSVYDKKGFQIVDQKYKAIKKDDFTLKESELNFRYYETLTSEQIKEIKDFYNNIYPNYDGKIVRTDEPDYWDFYTMMFNPYMKPRLVIAKDDFGNVKGYCRFDVDNDRITVTELCVKEDDFASCQALLGFVVRFAKLAGFELLTLAFSKNHLVWNLLKTLNVKSFAEPDGVRREIFMVRPAKGNANEIYNDLLWSLADKF